MCARKLKAIAVTSPQRAKALPDVPTVAESGYPGFEVETWFGLVAPAGTPQAVVAQLHDAWRPAPGRPRPPSTTSRATCV
jgi:tripartite-type tricarboxylate transporter receptor subunit TctC